MQLFQRALVAASLAVFITAVAAEADRADDIMITLYEESLEEALELEPGTWRDIARASSRVRRIPRPSIAAFTKLPANPHRPAQPQRMQTSTFAHASHLCTKALPTSFARLSLAALNVFAMCKKGFAPSSRNPPIPVESEPAMGGAGLLF
jgi:hypothetical protein